MNGHCAAPEAVACSSVDCVNGVVYDYTSDNRILADHEDKEKAVAQVRCMPEFVSVLQFLVALQGFINEEIRTYFRAGRPKKPTDALVPQIDPGRLEADIVHGLRERPPADDAHASTTAQSSTATSHQEGTSQELLLSRVHAGLLNCLHVRKVDAIHAYGKDGWIELLAAELRTRPELYDLSGPAAGSDPGCSLYDQDGASILDRYRYEMLHPRIRVVILLALCEVVSETNESLRRVIWEMAKQEQECSQRLGQPTRRHRRARKQQEQRQAPFHTRRSTTAAAGRSRTDGCISKAKALRTGFDSTRKPAVSDWEAAMDDSKSVKAPSCDQVYRRGDGATRIDAFGEDDYGWRYWVPGGLRAAAACGCFRIYRLRYGGGVSETLSNGSASLTGERLDGGAAAQCSVPPQIEVVVRDYADRVQAMERLFQELGGDAMSSRNRRLWSCIQDSVIAELEHGYLAAVRREVRISKQAARESCVDQEAAITTSATEMPHRSARTGRRQRPTYNEDELFDAAFAQMTDSSAEGACSSTFDSASFESDTSWSETNASSLCSDSDSDADGELGAGARLPDLHESVSLSSDDRNRNRFNLNRQRRLVCLEHGTSSAPGRQQLFRNNSNNNSSGSGSCDRLGHIWGARDDDDDDDDIRTSTSDMNAENAGALLRHGRAAETAWAKASSGQVSERREAVRKHDAAIPSFVTERVPASGAGTPDAACWNAYADPIDNFSPD